MRAPRPPLPDVVHNTAARRFEIAIGHDLARADYRMDGNVMRLVHTEVPVAQEGKGVAGALVRAALAHAEAHDLKVAPMCSYVRSYMQRHPETQALLAPGTAL
jgi:predicted GNAT family acetyltransferase